MTRHARTNGDVLSKLRVSNKKKKEKHKPTYACGWWPPTHAVVVVAVDVAKVKGKGNKKEKKREENTYWQVFVVDARSGGDGRCGWAFANTPWW